MTCVIRGPLAQMFTEGDEVVPQLLCGPAVGEDLWSEEMMYGGEQVRGGPRAVIDDLGVEL